MRQTACIIRQRPTTQQDRPGFMDLPRFIRTHVLYLCAESEEYDAGEDFDAWRKQLFSPHHVIAIGYRGDSVYFYAAETYDCTGSRVIHTAALLRAYGILRLINRGTNAEVVALICNKYRIFLHGPILSDAPIESFQHLLANCRRLIVHPGHEVCDIVGCSEHRSWCPQPDGVRYIAPWRAPHESSHTDQHMVLVNQLSQGWHKLAAYLTTVPDLCENLDFGLWFETSDHHAARTLLAPLSRLRVLRCSIHFGEYQIDQDVLDLVRQTVLVSTNTAHRSEPFRLLDLPTEIRQHVLSYTDLVAPLRQIQWDHERKYIIPDRGFRHAMLTCHWRPFCRRPDDTVWPPCSCFIAPTSIFLVCRSVCEDAKRVFYTSNRFSILYGGDRTARVGARMISEASAFLSKAVSRGNFRYLRDLEFGFQTFDSFKFELDDEAYKDWTELVQSLVPHTHQRISITIYLGERYEDDGFEVQRPSAERLRRWSLVHHHLITPLACLRESVKTFFIFVRFPWPLYPVEVLPWREKREVLGEEHMLSVLKAQETTYATRLEAIVMGESYNGMEQGKLCRWTSRWKEHGEGESGNDFENEGL